jgi:hypothetical protein
MSVVSVRFAVIEWTRGLDKSGKAVPDITDPDAFNSTKTAIIKALVARKFTQVDTRGSPELTIVLANGMPDEQQQRQFSEQPSAFILCLDSTVLSQTEVDAYNTKNRLGFTQAYRWKTSDMRELNTMVDRLIYRIRTAHILRDKLKVFGVQQLHRTDGLACSAEHVLAAITSQSPAALQREVDAVIAIEWIVTRSNDVLKNKIADVVEGAKGERTSSPLVRSTIEVVLNTEVVDPPECPRIVIVKHTEGSLSGKVDEARKNSIQDILDMKCVTYVYAGVNTEEEDIKNLLRDGVDQLNHRGILLSWVGFASANSTSNRFTSGMNALMKTHLTVAADETLKKVG